MSERSEQLQPSLSPRDNNAHESVEQESLENQAMFEQLCAMQLQMNNFLMQSASMQSLAYWCWMNYYMMHWPQMQAQIPVAPSEQLSNRTRSPSDDAETESDPGTSSPGLEKVSGNGAAVWTADEVLQAVGRCTTGLPRAPKEMLVFQEDLEKELTSKMFDPRGPSVPGRGQKLSVCPYKLDCRHQHCTKAHMATEITCYFWERGNCFKKTSCPYLHGYVRS